MFRSFIVCCILLIVIFIFIHREISKHEKKENNTPKLKEVDEVHRDFKKAIDSKVAADKKNLTKTLIKTENKLINELGDSTFKSNTTNNSIIKNKLATNIIKDVPVIPSKNKFTNKTIKTKPIKKTVKTKPIKKTFKSKQGLTEILNKLNEKQIKEESSNKNNIFDNTSFDEEPKHKKILKRSLSLQNLKSQQSSIKIDQLTLSKYRDLLKEEYEKYDYLFNQNTIRGAIEKTKKEIIGEWNDKLQALFDSIDDNTDSVEDIYKNNMYKYSRIIKSIESNSADKDSIIKFYDQVIDIKKIHRRKIQNEISTAIEEVVKYLKSK